VEPKRPLLSDGSGVRRHTDHFPPDVEAVLYGCSVLVGGQAVAAWAELGADGTKRLEEPLGVLS